MVKPADEKLAALLAEDKDVVAARLFAASFVGDVPTSLEFRKVRAELRAMAGVGRMKALVGHDEPDFAFGVELVLRWERALLAARIFGGSGSSMYVLLLSDGESVLQAADPYDAALTAIRSWAG